MPSGLGGNGLIMARALFAWELGDGLGHLMRMRPVARRLRDAGHEPVFVVRNVPNGHLVLAADGFAVLQAPLLVPRPSARDQGKPIGSYGDIINTFGFDDVDRLESRVLAWRAVIDLVDPALIVTDFAPTVGLAEYPGERVVSRGDGFTLPPCTLPAFPKLRDTGPWTPEAEILSRVTEVQQRLTRPVPATLPAILEAAASFVVTLPELDRHAALRPDGVVGPVDTLPASLDEVTFAAEPPDDYFCYLSLQLGSTPKALDGLLDCGLRGSLFLRDAEPSAIAQWRGKGLVIHERPPPMAEAAARARCVVHHGGLGSSLRLAAHRWSSRDT